ncbi:hypothetical protein D1V06_24730 [Salmonella enterica]|nr:hypothetical protein [Salmonella enterica]
MASRRGARAYTGHENFWVCVPASFNQLGYWSRIQPADIQPRAGAAGKPASPEHDLNHCIGRVRVAEAVWVTVKFPAKSLGVRESGQIIAGT